MRPWLKPIKKMKPCPKALKWAEEYPSLDEAWDACERGDWMLKLLGKTVGSPQSASYKRLVLATCQCARLFLPYVKRGKVRALHAIETAEAWAQGAKGVTLADMKDAYDAIYAACTGGYATYTAGYAAYDIVIIVARAADVAAHADKEIPGKCANIVRKYFPTIKRGKE